MEICYCRQHQSLSHTLNFSSLFAFQDHTLLTSTVSPNSYPKIPCYSQISPVCLYSRRQWTLQLTDLSTYPLPIRTYHFKISPTHSYTPPTLHKAHPFTNDSKHNIMCTTGGGREPPMIRRSLSVRCVLTMALMIQQMKMVASTSCGMKAPKTKVGRPSLTTWEMGSMCQ